MEKAMEHDFEYVCVCEIYNIIDGKNCEKKTYFFAGRFVMTRRCCR